MPSRGKMMGESPDTEYTPTTEQVRTEWVESNPNASETNKLHAGAEFDRWLSAYTADVAAKALEDAASWMQVGIGDPYRPEETESLKRNWRARRKYLCDRAAHIREEHPDE